MTRSIKIETDGDFFKRKVFPKIRLCGKWLTAAGFPPESRVTVTAVAPGVLMLNAHSPDEKNMPRLVLKHHFQVKSTVSDINGKTIE